MHKEEKSPFQVIGNARFIIGQFIFGILALGIIAVIGLLVLYRLHTLDNMELSLLDFRLRYRADKIAGPHAAPSSDIVILGLDESTGQYLRTHPEMGLSSLTLPRETLASVLNYLTRQGTRAIILDLEFKDPKPDDPVLADAIRRNGHVYAASRMDTPLSVFMERQAQTYGINTLDQQADLAEVLLYEAFFRPLLLQTTERNSRFMPFKAATLLDLGLGPFFTPTTLEPVLWQQAQKLAFQTRLKAVLQAQSPFTERQPVANALYSDIAERAFSSLCTHNAYQAAYRNNPVFLSLLEQSALSINLSQDLPESIDRQITRCYTYPTVTPILHSLKGIGVPSIEYEQDAYIRSASVLYRGYQGNFYTYLGIRPVPDLLNTDTILYAPNVLTIGTKRIPLQDNQQALINWRDPQLLARNMFRQSGMYPNPDAEAEIKNIDSEKSNTLLGGGHLYRQIPILAILQRIQGQQPDLSIAGQLYNIPYHPQTGQFSFKNKIVIIGNTVTDIHRTPMSNTTFGPEVVAAVLDMIWHDTIFIQKTPLALEWGLIALISLAITVALVRFESLSAGFTVGFILIIAYWLMNLFIFVHYGYWLTLIVPTLALGSVLVAAMLYRYYIHDREKHLLTNVFSKYVSPQIMSEIVKNPEKALDNLKGEKRELTVLFADLQDFTHQFENIDPELIVSQLNEYFDVMTEIILKHGGTYDKYMGDCVMAFFGAPTDMPNHAEMACRAALEMQQVLSQLNARWENENRQPLAHGVGISSGEMFVGNFGSKNIKNFTVMGSNVNLGARLETFTRTAHWPIIISRRTWELIGSAAQVKDLGFIQVKGFSEPVQAYGLESLDNHSI